MSMIFCRSSGGSEPKLNRFFVVKTLLPIWSDTLDESPWIALATPIPVMSKLCDGRPTNVGSGLDNVGQQDGYESSHS